MAEPVPLTCIPPGGWPTWPEIVGKPRPEIQKWRGYTSDLGFEVVRIAVYRRSLDVQIPGRILNSNALLRLKL